MIADYADKLNTYEEFKDYADMVQQFIKKQKEENLPEGRYDLTEHVSWASGNLDFQSVLFFFEKTSYICDTVLLFEMKTSFLTIYSDFQKGTSPLTQMKKNLLIGD